MLKGLRQIVEGAMASATPHDQITWDRRRRRFVLFDDHGEDLGWLSLAPRPCSRDSTLTEAVIKKFGDNMFGGDFVFSVSREFVRRCRTPLLLQPGTDKPHPAETSAEIARLAPNLEIQKDWRAPTHLAESIRRVTDFLTRNTPAS